MIKRRSFILEAIISRYSLITINIISFVVCFVCLKEVINLIHFRMDKILL